MNAVFKVDVVEAQKFQTVWTQNGLAVVLPPAASQFAADFANIVLRNFIAMCQRQAKDAQAKMQPVPPKALIIEGT